MKVRYYLKIVNSQGISQSLPDYIVAKLRKEGVDYAAMCSKITTIGIALDRMKLISSQSIEKLYGKFFGLAGEKTIPQNVFKQYLKFREFVIKCLKVGKTYL